MKKSLLALAVLGAFAGAASAQSSVTLYGIVDAGYMYTDFKRGGVSAISALDPGLQAGNRLGVRGSEALGGGLNAIFALEAGFGMDTGASLQGGRLFGRQAWLGLEGGFGTLAAGRMGTFSSGTGAWDMFGAVDPFGTAWVFAGLQSTFSPSATLRVDNALMYRTPKFGGFQAGAGYSFNASGVETPGSGNNNRVLFTGANFAAGPFFAALTYDVIKYAAAISGEDQKMLQVGGTWDLKFLKLHAGYAKEDNVRPNVIQAFLAAGPGANADAWMVGLSAPVGAFTFMASYQERDGDSILVGTTRQEGDGNVWAVGGKYDLSRRTNLYLVYADSKGEGSLSTGNATGPFGPTTLAVDAANRKALMAGINHRF